MRVLIFLIALFTLFSVNTYAQSSSSPRVLQKDKSNVERERTSLRQRIVRLRQEFAKVQREQKSAKQGVKKTQEAILLEQVALAQLEDSRDRLENKITQVDQELNQLSTSITDQQALLQQLVRPHIEALRQSNNNSVLWHLLFASGIQEATRRTHFLGAISHAQISAIRQLQQNQSRLTAVQEESTTLRQQLASNQQELLRRVNQLEKEFKIKKATVTTLSNKISAQEKDIQNALTAEKKLADVIAKLTREIAQAQKRAQALAKKRAQQAAREKKLNKNKSAAPPDTPAETVTANTQFSTPLQGQLVVRYGAPTPTGAIAKGVFIAAPLGAAVNASAAGTVIFAETLKGFGPLLIIDHGLNLLSVYGNNSRLLADIGDVVKRGQVIARVGDENHSLLSSAAAGLYFELRKDGRPINPLTKFSVR